MKSEALRIALFGGTFDPVHLGHVRMAEAARDALELDRVVLIPCALSPHKTDGPMPTSGECRMEMIRLAGRGRPWLEVDGCELEREGISYSWQTAEEFCKRHPGARLFWILGEDQWRALPRWGRPEYLAGMVEFIVFARDERRPESREGMRAHFLAGVHEASATKIREALREKQSGDFPHPWLEPEVLRYIREHGLYGAGINNG